MAILVLKNLYPQEYAILQENKSVINKIFQNKLELIEEEIRDNKPRIEHLKRALNDKEYYINPKYSILGLIKELVHQHQTQLEIASHNWYKVTALIKEISNIDSIILSDINWDILKTINALILKKINFPHIEYKIPLNAYIQEQIRGLVELKESK